ncbi:MAG: hypothetical protein PHW82_07150 [Bacteroidales bacterium]|nr:hypothetical protein [Bacteroidales bacterium]
MKTIKFIGTILCAAVLLSGCNKDDDTNNDLPTNGLIEFKCINPLANNLKNALSIKALLSNPPLVGDTTATYLTSWNWTVGDVWVSQGEVKAGETDNLEWIRLTNVTNQESKLFEDYTFPAKEIPVGNYKSIKITFKNIFYRHVQLISDPSVKYELLETMGSWTAPCDPNDDSWAATNYFSSDGNHALNTNGVFELVSQGEKIGGFNIIGDKKATISWRFYAGVTTPSINYLIDQNNNLEWDCGVDLLIDESPPELKYMWDFVVEYE